MVGVGRDTTAHAIFSAPQHTPSSETLWDCKAFGWRVQTPTPTGSGPLPLRAASQRPGEPRELPRAAPRPGCQPPPGAEHPPPTAGPYSPAPIHQELPQHPPCRPWNLFTPKPPPGHASRSHEHAGAQQYRMHLRFGATGWKLHVRQYKRKVQTKLHTPPHTPF